MRIRLIALFLAISLTGCATLIVKRGEFIDPNAPVNETKGGTARFPLDSRSGREYAYKKMHDYCKGAYRVIREYMTSGRTTGTINENGGVDLSSKSYWNIDFECEDQTRLPKPSPIPRPSPAPRGKPWRQNP